ncbi:MAG: DNA/RNA non-specific endonuclease [Bacteroidales bacterium]|nr:DNA/RNA non-specific endonuclease [Bacteroidales bacterium]
MKAANHILKAVVAVLAATTVLAACNPTDLGNEPEVNLRIDKVDAGSKSNQFIGVKAAGEWSLEIKFEGGEQYDVTQWAYLEIDSVTMVRGVGDRNDIVFGWAANNSPEARKVTLLLTCAGGKTAQAEFTQAGREGAAVLPTKIVSETVPDWLELPATSDPDLYFITHYCNYAGGEQRNYSFYWDTAALVAHWVAYPLNKRLAGSGGRTNEWGLDPKIPRRLQPVVFRGYGNASYEGGYYNRGHQLPSADRLTYEPNVQTFYGTNMTPQRGELNSEAWAVLEGMVRTWSNALDTLYVVTGCVLDGSTEYVTDNEGKRVKVPTGYFKALLGYKKSGTVGMTGSTGGYTGTAFWFDHKGYAKNTSTVLAQRITIDQLETRTGIDFFVNLPSRIGADKAASVEASTDSWWK